MATFPTTLQVLGMQLPTDGNHPTDAMDILNSDSGRVINKGLTKREYFAAMAMQALITRGAHLVIENVTHNSVVYADSLIEALNK
jgi:hypothetical protein